MDSQEYEKEMEVEGWSQSGPKPSKFGSIIKLSCFTSFHFSSKHIYDNSNSLFLQGFDVEGEDPREVVQNILFGDQYAVVKEEMAIVSSVNLFDL